MPDWRLPNDIHKDAEVYIKLIHSLAGIYMYEWLISLDFEWDFISGKKRLCWPMIFYFANRYFMLVDIIGIIVLLDDVEKLNCQALTSFAQLAANIALGLASINLSIRTMAMWSQNRYIVGGLVLVILGHWSMIIFHGVQEKGILIPGVGCQMMEIQNKVLPAIFIYSMCFDLIVLFLTVYKLIGITSSPVRDLMGRGRLTHIIFADGLIFFILAFLSNLIATVFMVLNINQTMSIVFNIPATIISTIVACRAVRRLTNFAYGGAEIINTYTSSSNLRPITRGNERVISSSQYECTTHSGVHVQMETFTHIDDDNNIFPKVKEGSERDVEFKV